jgi:hypothetical protein
MNTPWDPQSLYDEMHGMPPDEIEHGAAVIVEEIESVRKLALAGYSDTCEIVWIESPSGRVPQAFIWLMRTCKHDYHDDLVRQCFGDHFG